MRILTKKEMKLEPNGTVFSLYEPDEIGDGIHIKTGNYIWEDGSQHWNGELDLIPFLDEKRSKELNENRATQWCTTDSSDADYEEKQLFAVYSKSEVQQMIECLSWSLSGCETYLDQDKWFGED